MMGKRLNYQEIIKESETELRTLLKKETDGINRDRLRFLLSLKDGTSKTQSAASKIIGLSLRQGQNNWSKYKSGGLKKLLEKIKGSPPCKLTNDQLIDLEKRLEKDDIQFLHEAVVLIEKEYGQVYTESGVYYLFKRLKIKKKTGRPVNIRQDKDGLESFKKTTST